MREGLKIKSIRISSFLLPYLLTGGGVRPGNISAPQNYWENHKELGVIVRYADDGAPRRRVQAA